MEKYFKNDILEWIDSEEIAGLLRRADKHPEKFLRILFNKDHMLLNLKTQAEFEIRQAVLFFWDIHGKITCYDFYPGDTQRQLYAAVDLKNFVALSLEDPKHPLERFCMFDSSETIMGLFKTDNSTIVLLYDGTKDSVNYSYLLENPGYARFFDKQLELLAMTQSRTDNTPADTVY